MIPKETLERLAGLYDRHAHAFDPFHPDAERAEREFLHLLDQLRMAEAPATTARDFRRAVIGQCKQFLKKNP